MKFRVLMITALLGLSTAAFAATTPPSAGSNAGPMGKHEGPCKTDPSKCQADAAKFDQWCSANAEKCTDLKAWAERRREFCEANKQKCEERRHHMMEHMKDKKQAADSDQGDDRAPPPG